MVHFCVKEIGFYKDIFYRIRPTPLYIFTNYLRPPPRVHSDVLTTVNYQGNQLCYSIKSIYSFDHLSHHLSGPRVVALAMRLLVRNRLLSQFHTENKTEYHFHSVILLEEYVCILFRRTFIRPIFSLPSPSKIPRCSPEVQNVCT